MEMAREVSGTMINLNADKLKKYNVHGGRISEKAGMHYIYAEET